MTTLNRRLPGAPPLKTNDTHIHYFPQKYIDLIAQYGKRCGTTVVTDDKGGDLAGEQRRGTQWSDHQVSPHQWRQHCCCWKYPAARG